MSEQEKQSQTQERNNHVNLKLEALGGLAAGVIGTVIGYPLDLVKTRMQTSSIATANTSIKTKPSNNLFQVGYNVLKHEGIFALYKGMTPPLISLTILNTMTFKSYNYIRTQYNAKRGFDIRNFMAGFTIAPMASMISTVEHLLKTQMQMDNIHEKRFHSSWHCVKTLVKEHGTIRILYLGHGVNTLREGVFIGTYFYTYEGMRIQLDRWFGSDKTTSSRSYDPDQKAPAWTIPISGGISGAWAWFVSFPLDCVKAGIQGQSLSSCKQHKLNGMVTVFQQLIRTKGWRGLYSGVTPSIMRAFVVSSTRFTAYEMVVKLCKDYL
jgi:solute carrier family 25 carnitine/acylcarnitine transporter 20/29